MNEQGNTLQHYIDVLKWLKTGVTQSVLNDIAARCFDLNLYTSECIDRVKLFIEI